MKKTIKMTIEFVCLLGIGCLLLIVAHMLPANRIREHIKESANWMSQEGNYPYVGSLEQAYVVDNWTEATLLMFNYTADENRPIYSAFVATSYMPADSTGVSRLQGVISEDWRQNREFIETRGANWIGYNIFLRTGLLFFSISELRVVLNVCSYSIVLLTFLMLCKYHGGYKAFGLGFTLFLYNFYTLSISWTQGVFCVIIACMTILYVLKHKEYTDYINLMFIVGIITAYFDWLSIPLVTWGLPIVIILAKEYQKENHNNFKTCFMLLLRSGWGWCLGYVLMTFSKTMIAIGVQGTEAWTFFVERLSADTTSKSLREFFKGVYRLICSGAPMNLLPDESALPIVFIGLVALLQIYVIIRYTKSRALNISYLLVQFAPIVYYIYAKGHIGHVAIEFRSLMISCYAAWLMLESLYHQMARFWQKKLFCRKGKNGVGL